MAARPARIRERSTQRTRVVDDRAPSGHNTAKSSGRSPRLFIERSRAKMIVVIHQ